MVRRGSGKAGCPAMLRQQDELSSDIEMGMKTVLSLPFSPRCLQEMELQRREGQK